MISININVATREKSESVQCNSTSLAEELCIIVCKRLHISQIATTLFALRLIDSNLYLAPNASVEQYNNLTLRIRYRVPNLTRLKNLDVQAHNYYFHQVKNDVMDNKIPEIVYAKHRDELLGLGITDMYRLMVEEKKNREEVEKDYRKYIPREVIKKHKMFTKKPIHNTLMQFSKSAAAADPGFIKEQYLKKFNTMAPNYLSEEYNVLFDSNASNDAVILHVMPFHIEEPGLRIYYKIKKQWEHLCAIDEICSMSSRSDGTVEINRKNGIPAYLKFSEVQQMLSFISVCDGYYRLMVKWTFNLCNEVTSPGLQRLHNLKCHGPVGGEFSYHKLEEKRANKSGCFIMRQCEKKFDTYYIDVCSKNSTKPETYKIENIANSYILYDKDKTQYSTLPKLIADHNNAEENIYLQECLPPSEYDKSQVLLCEDVGHGPANRIGQVNLDDLLANIRGPRCIHTRDILVFKSPWCYAETDVNDVFEKHFCDVPFCDVVNDPIFTIENGNYYTHYVSLDKSTSNLIFGIKLWDPDSIIYAYGKLTFSVLGTPAKREDFIRWGMGIEIIISSAGIGLTIGNHKMLLEPQPLLLSSMNYRYFNLLWTDDTIILKLPQEENKVLYVSSITNKGVLATGNDFSFYTFHGSNILWTFSESQSCEIHTTFETDYIMKWKLAKTNYRFEKAFHVRSYHSISIALLSTPIEYTFKILILIGLKDNITSIIFDDSHSPVITLKTVVKPNILDYWKWNEFLFTIEFDIFTLFWMHETGFVPVLSISDPHFKTIRWFSIGSIKSISHWSLNCKPEPIKPVYPPYCASFFVKFDYAGSQWVTSEGFPCIPWIDTENVNMFLKTKISNNDASLVYLKNHCRNRLKGINGPSCVAVTPLGFKKSICNVQMCSDLGCTSAGTGVDYVEKVNYTRQNYICTAWSSLDGDELAKFHKNAFEYDKDITQAKNYCRNPTRNIAGPWCFTTNKSVPVDLCNIPLCDEEIESTIIFVSAVEEKNVLLVFPEWKYFGLNIGFKVWDPERIDGLVIKIFPSSRKEYQSISIDQERRKIILHYRDTTTNISVVLAEKILPELIPVGKWGKYWLRLMKGSIMLGYKDLKHPIFKWSSTNEVINFEPLYIAFLPNNDYPIGINFPDRECLIEISTARRSSRMMSLGLWSMQKKLMYNNLRLSLRGDGKAIVSLHILPNTRVASSENLSLLYKAQWQVTQSKKFEVAVKMLKQDTTDKHMNEFIDKAGQWAFLQSSALVRLYGVMLRSPVAMVLEYLPLGSLDAYLREKNGIQIVELVEAASSLATALWHLAENNVVHGNIRCRKLLVAGRDSSHFSIKLSDPGLHTSYGDNEFHWLPTEFFNNVNLARMSSLADVWAFATTLWEIFSFGTSPAETNPTLTKKSYLGGNRLALPIGCPQEVYAVMAVCWHQDQHRRARPQVIMRDINRLHYQVYNSRRNVYSTVTPKTKTGSALSLTSNLTGESVIDNLVTPSESEQQYASMRSASSSLSEVNTTMTYDGDDDEDMTQYDFTSFSMPQMQVIFELDDYNVILQGRIGQGYYGEVFKGTLERNDDSEPRQVAIKRLKPTAQTSFDDFEREIKIMKSLKHRNIVEILGAVEEPEVQLIMEYVQHGSLQSYLKINRHTITVHRLLKYACDVAMGMEYLGTLNIVHRDLAARNILVVSEDHCKISDFGLAQFMQGDYYILKTNRDLPLKWYAPESVSGGKFSTKSDVWSYGVTLWEMFSFGEEPPAWGSEIALQERLSRLACPEFCPMEVYVNMLLPCWKFIPTERLTFTQLIAKCMDLGLQFFS